MLKDLDLFKKAGCSDAFLQIVEKYTNESMDIETTDRLIVELESYKAGEELCSLEQDVLDSVKERFVSMVSTPNGVFNDDSTEAAIRRTEMDYNGDVFTTMGYELRTEDGERY